MIGTNSDGGGQDDEAENDRLGRRRADVGEHDLQRGHRRGQELVDRAGELREIDAERGVGDALGEQRQHDQPRHDEGAVGDAVHLGHARADRGAEHHEVERGGDDRRHQALQQRAQGARHLEPVDGPDAVPVERREFSLPRSCAVAHQADEDVLERALPRVQVLEADARARSSR